MLAEKFFPNTQNKVSDTTVSRWTLSPRHATWNQHRPESNAAIVGTWSWRIPGNRFQRSTYPTPKSDTKAGPTVFWSKPFLKNLETWKDHRPTEAGKARLFTGKSLKTNNGVAHFGENHGENLEPSLVTEHYTNRQPSIIPREQYGFLPQKSCEQVVWMVTNFVRDAWKKDEHPSAVFLDVSGAYDNVLHKFLIRQLRIRGVPEYLTR